jgi:hypothetical protein
MASKGSAHLGDSGLRCLLCGEPNGISLYLNDLETVHCTHCEQDHTLSEVRDTIDQWALVLSWRDLAPPRCGAGSALRPARAGEAAG